MIISFELVKFFRRVFYKAFIFLTVTQRNTVKSLKSYTAMKMFNALCLPNYHLKFIFFCVQRSKSTREGDYFLSIVGRVDYFFYLVFKHHYILYTIPSLLKFNIILCRGSGQFT